MLLVTIQNLHINYVQHLYYIYYIYSTYLDTSILLYTYNILHSLIQPATPYFSNIHHLAEKKLRHFYHVNPAIRQIRRWFFKRSS